jgi:uncharacterized membrane protein YgcG
MRKVALLLMAVAMVFTSCDTKRHKHKKAKVTSYRVPNTTTADPNDWLYYYLIFNNHSNSYYYYSSPTPVTSFAGTTWTTSQTMPTELVNQTPTAEFEEALTDLPDEIEVEMDEAIDAENEAEADTDNGSDDGDGDASDASDGGDSGSGDSGGDSGGGDSGGGDGGGGDGGGGGE